MRGPLAGVVLLLYATFFFGQDKSAQSILERFEAAKPTPDQLAFYGLDWSPTLAAAKEQATREQRPIVFLWITNITAGCDFFSGHT